MKKEDSSIQRDVLLAQVARLYYEFNFSQSEIAQRMELSRPYISKLLSEAKRKGIVKIRIVAPPTMPENGLETRIRERFGLKKAIIVPNAKGKKALTQVGEATAEYLNTILKDNDVIGFTWGETIYECAKAIYTREELHDLVTVQMCGGLSNTSKNVYVAEITQLLSESLHSKGYMLPFPAVVDSVQAKKVIMKEHTMKEAIENAKKATIALFTLGFFGESCALAKTGYLKPEEIESLLAQGAVGDICTHIIDENGAICSESLEERTVAVPYDIIKKIPLRIGISVGKNKVKSILAALRGGIINVLVTDEDTVALMREEDTDIFA